MKALVIYSHTYSETSKAGNAILEVLEATPDFEVRNIDALYPDLNKIDIAAEQKALLEAEVIMDLPTGVLKGISFVARSSFTPLPQALGKTLTQAN